MHFNKMQALGNDFVFIDKRDLYGIDLDENDIQIICDRNYGVGCDTLVIYDASESTQSLSCEFYNANGSQAEICVNALRCLGFLMKKEYEETDITVKCVVDERVKRVAHVKCLEKVVCVNIGVPVFDADELHIKQIKISSDFLNIGANVKTSVGQKLDIACVSVGNPHVAIFSPIEDDEEQERIGEALNNKKYFKEGVNVSFVNVIDRHTIEIDVYERGCGFTLACGSGACAAAFLAYKKGLIDNWVIVKQRGGDLEISIASDDSIEVSGDCSFAFSGEYSPEDFDQEYHLTDEDYDKVVDKLNELAQDNKDIKNLKRLIDIMEEIDSGRDAEEILAEHNLTMDDFLDQVEYFNDLSEKI